MMMVRITTESGSMYDVDQDEKTISRRGAAYDGMGRATEEPRAYVTARWAIGGRIIIVWPQGTELLPGSPSDAMAILTSSRVVSVEDCI